MMRSTPHTRYKTGTRILVAGTSILVGMTALAAPATAVAASTPTVQFTRPADNTGIAEGKSIVFQATVTDATQLEWSVDDTKLSRCAGKTSCEIGAGFAPGQHTVKLTAAGADETQAQATRTLWIIAAPKITLTGDKAGSIVQGNTITLHAAAENYDNINWTIQPQGATPEQIPACQNQLSCTVGDELTPQLYTVIVTAENDFVLPKATDRFTLTVTERETSPDLETPKPEDAAAPAQPAASGTGATAAPGTATSKDTAQPGSRAQNTTSPKNSAAKNLAVTGAGAATGCTALGLLLLAGASYMLAGMRRRKA